MKTSMRLWWVMAATCLGAGVGGGFQAPVPTRELPNLVYNSSFEMADWMDATQAECWSPRPSVTRRETNIAHSGSASLHIQGPAPQGYIFQKPFNLLPGTEYEVSFWVQGNVSPKAGAQIVWGPERRGTDWATPTGQWVQARGRFKTPPVARTNDMLLYLNYRLSAGEEIWVDDVSVRPVDGKVPVAAAPVISPAQERPAGAVQLALIMDLPGAAVRYTLDGTEPNAFSTLYTGPFNLNVSTTVRARTVQAGRQDSPVSEQKIILAPVLNKGVPIYPVVWEQDVAAWWAGHPYNPASKTWTPGAVVSPEPRINVADVHKQHPESQTAGIEEALNLLPPEGGTLFFPKSHGPYMVAKPESKERLYYYTQGAILIARRSNLHFVSDGAEIQCAWTVFGFSSRSREDGTLFSRPVRNFYFKGLTFDGQGASDIAVNFIHCTDILFEGCTFRNYALQRAPRPGQVKPPLSWSGHPAMIVGTAMTDNLWCLDCNFQGGRQGVYIDGVHNGGLVRCKFSGLMRGLLLMTNNDMAPFDSITRNGQYIVVSDCDFEAAADAMNLSASHVLVENCRARNMKAFFVVHGRGRSSVEKFVRYEMCAMLIRGNTLENVDALGEFAYGCTTFAPRAPIVFEQNKARGLKTILNLLPTAPDAILSGLQVRSNRLTGAAASDVRVEAAGAARVENIMISNNEITGAGVPGVTDEKGRPLQVSGVAFKDNLTTQP